MIIAFDLAVSVSSNSWYQSRTWVRFPTKKLLREKLLWVTSIVLWRKNYLQY